MSKIEIESTDRYPLVGKDAIQIDTALELVQGLQEVMNNVFGQMRQLQLVYFLTSDGVFGGNVKKYGVSKTGGFLFSKEMIVGTGTEIWQAPQFERFEAYRDALIHHVQNSILATLLLRSATHHDLPEGFAPPIAFIMQHFRGVCVPILVSRRINGLLLSEVLLRLEYFERWSAEKLPFIIKLLSIASIMHHRGCIHRDIKPDNILLEYTGERQPNPVLIDFGLSQNANEQTVPAHQSQDYDIGSFPYFPPELSDETLTTCLSTAADIFSLGIIMAEIVSIAVREAISVTEMKTPVVRSRHANEQLNPLSHVLGAIYQDPMIARNTRLRQLILAMTSFRPESRPTAKEAKKDIEAAI